MSTESVPSPTRPERSDDYGPIATPRRVAFASIPSLLLLLTPLLPFGHEPTRWLGVPAIYWWVTVLVVLTVVFLQVLDRSINRQEQAHRAAAAVRPELGEERC